MLLFNTKLLGISGALSKIAVLSIQKFQYDSMTATDRQSLIFTIIREIRREMIRRARNFSFKRKQII